MIKKHLKDRYEHKLDLVSGSNAVSPTSLVLCFIHGEYEASLKKRLALIRKRTGT